jgi:hypothetical protein
LTSFVALRPKNIGTHHLLGQHARDWNPEPPNSKKPQVCEIAAPNAIFTKTWAWSVIASGYLEKGERERRIAGSLKPIDPDIKKSLEILQERKSGKLGEIVQVPAIEQAAPLYPSTKRDCYNSNRTPALSSNG